MDTSEGKGAPSKIKGGAQAGTPTWVSALLSARFWDDLACLAPF